MPDVYEDIRKWLRQQPDWLQQAAEVVLASGNISDEDIRALTERLKTAEGQQTTATRSFGELGPATTFATTLRLVEIGDISGIENLNPRRPLAFGDGNLSVIYGHNGSGKSGYTRVLKRVCGKPRAVELRPNVFKATPSSRKCHIAYAVNEDKRKIDWMATGKSVSELRAVDIFDTDVALYYLSEETAVTYTPPTVALFEALASICDRIKVRLEAEQQALISTLPSLPGTYVDTETGKAFQGLTAEINDNEAQQLVHWSEADEQSLAALTQRLAAADPAALARNERGSKDQVDDLVNLLRSAVNAFGEPRLTEIRAMQKTAQTSRVTAVEAAQILATDLEGVGSDTWRAMWEAARNYSLIAYPGRDYPVADKGERCVLCQQYLDDETQGRLRNFESFVQSELEKKATAAETTYQQALNTLPTALSREQITMRCQAAGLTEDGWAQKLNAFWQQVSAAHQSLFAGEVHGAAAPILVPEELLTALARQSETLQRQATQHEADAKNFDRIQATKNKLELEARRWMSQQTEAIRGEIGRLRRQDQYASWQRAVNPRPVSLKAGEIAEQVVTQAFVDRFNQELKALGASRIQVELIRTRTARGIALHKIRLKDAYTGQDAPDAVLSEGERRVVGLAAFLADVTDRHRSAPFIFDDPISSLDQDFEWHVAMRLTQLAQTRQVLVFTHRLSLYGAMEDTAKKMGDEWKKQHLVMHCIERYSGTAGHPVDQAAWNANTAKANNILLDRVDAAKRAGDEGGADAYRSLAQGICSDFRKLLERTVEDDLLNSIVRRHRRSITTENRLQPLISITAEDCKLIDALMTKYSCYEHSQSDETPVFIPEEVELREDLEKLRDWRREFKTRLTRN